MKWIPKISKEMDKIEEELNMKNAEPISIKDIEQGIELIDVANKINAYFKIKLYLSIGEFYVDSDSFRSIKLMKKNKNEKDRVVISHYTALLSTETTINIENIYGFTIDIAYMNKWIDDENEQV